MKWFKLLFSLLITVAILYVLNTQLKTVPPLGSFFNPFSGFWQNNRTGDDLPKQLTIDVLKNAVTVYWDARHVAHIFAQNDYDLYCAQGYLVARDRLWQMEFQTHAAAGRLSEIIGDQMLELDRYQRRLGIPYAAEICLAEMMKNNDIRVMIDAFTTGVNAYIDQLDHKSIPLEYKILNYYPEPWTPLKMALLLKYMAWDLTGYNFHEEIMSRLSELLGPSELQKLFPIYPPFTDPIIPPGTPWNFQTPQERSLKNTLRYTQNESCGRMVETEMNIGSNNWAVSGSRTANGFPILCNDPHLGLSLPSTWYEIQLSSPNVNVYGYTMPGAPGVIIGFNEHIAWGVTNAETDVIDWYNIQFKDQTKSAYRYNDQWRPTNIRIEEIKVRGQESVYDTVYFTHYGPVVYLTNETPFQKRIPPGAAMRWTGHDPSDELLAFSKLNQSRNYFDYVDALSHYTCPPQNFAFASREGDIGLWHNGKIPIRHHSHALYINDGQNPHNEWKRWIPQSHLPHIKNPGRGFVSSANQYPTARDYPYELVGNYASYERGARINDQLWKFKSITIDEMKTLQNDVFNLTAQKVLPLMLETMEKERLNEDELRALKVLELWNFDNHAHLIAPTVFEHWWRELYDLTWVDEIIDGIQRPRRDVFQKLIITEPQSSYFDNRTTPEKENFRDVANQAFHLAIKKLVDSFGQFGPAWQWGNARGTDIRHLARIPGLGRYNLPTPGNYNIVNASAKHHGPSCRFIVELGNSPAAWGIYPGGQSGNPGSEYYDHTINDWINGKMYELIFLKSTDVDNKKIIAKTIIRGVK